MPIAGWGFAPALAAGNTVVLKPADADAAHGHASRRARRSRPGFPRASSRSLPGDGGVVGWRFVTHEAVRKVCFTGSSAVGKRVMAGCAEQVKRVTLELGGKSANIVFADADLERAAAGAPVRRLRQRRPGLLRSLAAPRGGLGLRPVHGAVRAGGEGVAACSIPPTRRAEMGPLISAGQRTSVDSFVDEQSTSPSAGSAPSGPGFWYPPTVLESSDGTDRAFREEIFGPVVSVAALRGRGRGDRDRQRQPLRALGLDLDARRRDGRCASRAASRPGRCRSTRTRRCATHTPFGGFKQSGIGRELGPDALRSFSEEKNVFISTEE